MKNKEDFIFNYDWPTTTKCKEKEWIHYPPPRYFLHFFDSEDKYDPSTWAVVDRCMDLVDGKHFKTKKACISSFIKRHKADSKV